jgi:hypothetical protein
MTVRNEAVGKTLFAAIYADIAQNFLRFRLSRRRLCARRVTALEKEKGQPIQVALFGTFNQLLRL